MMKNTALFDAVLSSRLVQAFLFSPFGIADLVQVPANERDWRGAALETRLTLLLAAHRRTAGARALSLHVQLRGQSDRQADATRVCWPHCKVRLELFFPLMTHRPSFDTNKKSRHHMHEANMSHSALLNYSNHVHTRRYIFPADTHILHTQRLLTTTALM